MGTTTIDGTLERWISAFEEGDPDAASTCLAPDVVFRSATTSAYEYGTREHLIGMETETLPVLEDRHATEVIGDGAARAVTFAFTVAGVAAEEAQVIHFRDDGLIARITAFVRPLPALAAIPAHAGPRLARAAGRPWLARQISWSSRPIAAALRKGDASMAPRTDPARQ